MSLSGPPPVHSWPAHLTDVVARTGIAPDIALSEVFDAAGARAEDAQMQSRAVMVDRLPERATDAAMETSILQMAPGETLADSVQAGTPRLGARHRPRIPDVLRAYSARRDHSRQGCLLLTSPFAAAARITPMMNVHPMRGEHRPQLAALLRSDEFALYTAAYQVERHHNSFPWWVAVCNGTVVGFLEGHFNSLYDERVGYGDVPGAWIYWVGVHPDHRRLGVARALIRAFAETALQKGDTHMACLIDQRTPTQDRLAFFARVGMEPVFPDDPDDVVAGPTKTVIERCT